MSAVIILLCTFYRQQVYGDGSNSLGNMMFESPDDSSSLVSILTDAGCTTYVVQTSHPHESEHFSLSDTDFPLKISILILWFSH